MNKLRAELWLQEILYRILGGYPRFDKGVKAAQPRYGVDHPHVKKAIYYFLDALEDQPTVLYRYDEDLWPDGGPEPEYQTEGAAAVDLVAAQDVFIPFGRRRMIRTGLHVEIPIGYEGQVRPRSGLAKKEGITVANSPGTIDSDFRGECVVILQSHGHNHENTVYVGALPTGYDVKKGDRIAQLVISKVCQATFVEAKELSSTERGEGGFGSTGV